MKKYAILMLALSGAIFQIGCGGKSSSNAASNTAAATDPNLAYTSCQTYQVYNTQYGCLDQRLDRCASGMGFYPTDGKCYPGISPSQLNPGYYASAMTIVDGDRYRKMLKDNDLCGKDFGRYQGGSSCGSENWMFFSLSTINTGGNSSLQGAPPAAIQGYYGSSSAFQFDYAGYSSQSGRNQVRINMRSSRVYSPINYQFTAQARTINNGSGFEVVYGPRKKKTIVTGSYVDAARTQLAIQVSYDGAIVAQGTVNKQAQ